MNHDKFKISFKINSVTPTAGSLYNASDELVYFKFTVHSSFSTIIRDPKAPLTKLIRPGF